MTTTYFNNETARRYGVEEAVLIDRIRLYGNIGRDLGLSTGLLLEREGPDFPFWDWGHVLGIVWRLVKAKALAVTSHDGSLYCSLLIDAE